VKSSNISMSTEAGDIWWPQLKPYQMPFETQRRHLVQNLRTQKVPKVSCIISCHLSAVT